MKAQASAIGDVVGAVISRLSGEKAGAGRRIGQAWAAVMEKKALSHARPVGFKAGRLVVNVDSSAWMYELNLRKQELLMKLNELLAVSGERLAKTANRKPLTANREQAIKEIMLRIGETG